LARIGPGQLVEPLNGDPTVVIQLPFVNNVGSFETVLRDYVIGQEATRGSLELFVGELAETRPRIAVTFAPIFCA
jgi:hypothetical protein